MHDPQMAALLRRGDVFSIDSDWRIFRAVTGAVILGLLLGIWLQARPTLYIPGAYLVLDQESILCTIDNRPVASPDKSESPGPSPEIRNKRVLRPSWQPLRSAKGTSHGTGNPSARVNESGLLRILNGKSNSFGIAGGQVLSNGLTGDLDAVLNRLPGLRTSGQKGFERKGMAGKAFNPGYSGQGGPAMGIDDLLPGLFGDRSVVPKLRVNQPKFKELEEIRIADGTGSLAGRSPEEIYGTVQRHLGGIRHEYNTRLREKPGLCGKITMRFTIEPSGRVTDCRVLRSTADDPVLEQALMKRILSWNFDACAHCGTATVTYPFVFSR